MRTTTEIRGRTPFPGHDNPRTSVDRLQQGFLLQKEINWALV